MAQTVKNLPELWETWVRFLGLEDPLKKGMATHSLAWVLENSGLENPMDGGAWRATVHGP